MAPMKQISLLQLTTVVTFVTTVLIQAQVQSPSPEFDQRSRIDDFQRSERDMGVSKPSRGSREASHRWPGSQCGGRQCRGKEEI